MRSTSAARWAEALALGFLVPFLGLLFPGDSTFAGSGYWPQIIASVMAAAFLGAGPGLAAAAAAAAGTLAVPEAARLAGLAPAALAQAGLAAGPGRAAALAAAAVAVCASFAAGSLRDSALRRESRLMGRFRELVRRDRHLSRAANALVALNRELEARVSGQRESVSALYARIRKMDSLELDKVLFALLEAAAVFSQAERAAVYEFDAGTGTLALRAWIGEAPGQSLPAESSIEGWVFRNDSAFSLRMLNSYANLARLDEGRSLIALPLKAGDLPWGVLNIQEMPFYRYNPVTEKNLEIVVGLAASYIKKASDFRDRVLRMPRNEVTGLPGYGELVRLLGEELVHRHSRRGSVSTVVIDFLGYEELVYAHSGIRALELVKAVAAAGTADGRAIAFHYKEDGQLAFLLPGVDRDGASLFCLGLMEDINSGDWKVDGQAVRLEPAFGLAAAGEGGSPEDLLAAAESVLDSSRRAFESRGAPQGEGQGGAASGGPGAAP